MSAQPHPAAAATLARWHAMIASGDLAELPSLIAADAVFRSPVAHKPYPGRAAVVLILRTVLGVFEDFTYHRQLVGDDGLDVALEFSAAIHGRQLKGVDLFRFGEDGLIRELEVMVRPLSCLQALGEEMGRRIGHVLATLQATPPAR